MTDWIKLERTKNDIESVIMSLDMRLSADVIRESFSEMVSMGHRKEGLQLLSPEYENNHSGVRREEGDECLRVLELER